MSHENANEVNEVTGSGLVFSRDNLPDISNFQPYIKVIPTMMMRIRGPFLVVTLEGVMCCLDGWLALDAQGNPYPIDAAVQLKSYALQPGYSKPVNTAELDPVTGLPKGV